MVRRDFMTVKGIGKKEGNRLYRDWYDNEDGILYYEDPIGKFLIRQVLPIGQDVELLKRTRNIAARNVWVHSKNGQYMTLDKVLPEDTNDQLLKMIREANPENNDKGCIGLFVFNSVSKEFIAALDVEPLDNDCNEGGITFTFSDNLVVRRRYELKLKRWVNNLFVETGLYPGGCSEAIFTGKEYVLVPIP